MEDRRNIIGDPDKLLESFREHLTDKGGIQRNSISELVSLMSDTNGKLVPKCISLCIISASDCASQLALCETDAWDTLLKWLQEAHKEENYSFLIELMQVYHDLPVTLEQLKRNVCPKLINSLAKKSENESVRALATEIVKKWKGVINKKSQRDIPEVTIRKRKYVPAIATGGEVQTFPKEGKRRRSTVKVPPTVRRTAGIEEASDQVGPKSRSEVIAKKSKSDSAAEKIQMTLPIESFHQKITVTATEPKKAPVEIHESSIFIDAIANSQPVVRKKRKVCKPETEFEEKLPVYEDEVPKKSAMTTFSTFTVEKKAKKCVSWAPENNLQQIRFFEVDETERVNVTRSSLAEVRQKEHLLERQLFKRNEEVEIKDDKWHPPVPLELLVSVEPGSKSVERQVQLERERVVLQAIYFTRESIPISPEEPDKEEFEAKVAVEIPLEDLHAKDLLIINKADGNSQMSLNPEVADLVKSLALNFNPDTTNTSTQPVQMSPPSVVSTSHPPVLSVVRPPHVIPSVDNSLISTNHDTGEILRPPDINPPPRIPGPHFISDRAPPPLHNGMRPRGPHPRPPIGVGGPLPYRHPHIPPTDGPPRFLRGGMPRPPFRGNPPQIYGGGRPLMNVPNRRLGRGDQVCKFFQQGNCRNGDNCHFVHPGFQQSNWR